MPCEIEEKGTSSGVSLTPERVSRYFGDPKNYLDIRRYIIEIRKESVREFVGNRRLDRILDVGCGDGSISIPLLNPQNRLTLLDISDRMLAKALSQVSPHLLGNVRTINEDFLNAPLEAGSYDLITCIGVLAHVESPERVIMKVASLLRPGGLLILECTDAENFTTLLTVFSGRIRNLLGMSRGYRTRLNSADDVIRMANGQGLDLLSVYRYNVALPLMGKVFSQATLRRMIVWIYGTPKNNRNRWLGKECLFLFQRSHA
jgi:2-polyprenyl-3-methyl-5-hydroxy-6-metoxy-1,4-benzoquinol methylase